VLIPRATESLKVIEKAFQFGQAGFSDLIDAQRVLLEFQLTQERALADRARHLGRLEMLVGRQLPRQAASQPAEPPRPAAG
jgi:outer membrane protein TolC